MKLKYKLLWGMLFTILLSVSIVSANGRLHIQIPDKLDLNCYQNKCKIEKDLWDDSNSECIFTPKILYKEHVKSIKEFESFLIKRLNQGEISRDEFLNIYTFSLSPSFPNYPDLILREKKSLLEFQCGEVGFIFGSENCDERLADNFLLLVDRDLLKSDLSFNEKNRIEEIYSSCLVAKTPEELKQQSKEKRFLLVSFLLFLSLSGGIILGNWVRHVKEERSSDYLIHGSLGFLMGVMHIFLSFFLSFFLIIWGFYILSFFILFLLLIGGLILEFIYYKKTKKLFWVYALIFSVIIIIYLIILRIYPSSLFEGLWTAP